MRCLLPLPLLALTFLVGEVSLPGGLGLKTSAEAQSLATPLTVNEFRIAGDEQRTRVLIYFDRKPDYSWFLLRNPYRLVLDLGSTEFALDGEDGEVTARGIVSAVQYGPMASNQTRIILSLAQPFSVDQLEVFENDNGQGYRLIMDLVADSPEAFELELEQRMGQAVAATTGAEGAVPARKDSLFTIVLDPGHGGIDGGARGNSGTQEKTVTLAFARELQARLQKNSKYHVVLTRDRDVFLRLDERVKIARDNGADLLISLHADSIRLKDFRGATVYTLSERPSDAEAAATAARENLSDELAGITADAGLNDVADILNDLMKRETQAFSFKFARGLVDEISKTHHVVNNPLRSAGFRVLSASDIPSALLELGFLSSEADEKQLNDPAWRARVIESVNVAIDAFAAMHP